MCMSTSTLLISFRLESADQTRGWADNTGVVITGLSKMVARRRLVTIATRAAATRRRVYRTVGTLSVVSVLGASGYYLQADYTTRRKIRVQWDGVKRFMRYKSC